MGIAFEPSLFKEILQSIDPVAAQSSGILLSSLQNFNSMPETNSTCILEVIVFVQGSGLLGPYGGP